MAERTVTIGEAAGILGVSTEALRKRIKRGTIKAHKNGGASGSLSWTGRRRRRAPTTVQTVASRLQMAASMTSRRTS